MSLDYQTPIKSVKSNISSFHLPAKSAFFPRRKSSLISPHLKNQEEEERPRPLSKKNIFFANFFSPKAAKYVIDHDDLSDYGMETNIKEV